MDNEKQQIEDFGASDCSVAHWSDALEVVEAMQQEEPQIYFMDGNSLTGKEAWNKCLRVVLQRLRAKADKANKNTVAIVATATAGSSAAGSNPARSKGSQERHRQSLNWR
jgi:hypothetical protein